jgi:hypothetical protein
MKLAFRRAGVLTPREKLEHLAKEAWREFPHHTQGGKRRKHITDKLQGDLTWTLFEDWKPAMLGAAVGWLLEQASEQEEKEQAAQAHGKPGAVVHHFPRKEAQAQARIAEAQNKKRAAAAVIVKTAVKLSKLDTFLINGQPIGDCTPEEAEGWAQSRERDARFVRALIHGCPAGRPIRESRKPTEADKLYDKLDGRLL